MPAFSFEAQTQRVKDVCLHFILSSFFFHPFNNFFYEISGKSLIIFISAFYFSVWLEWVPNTEFWV